MELIDFNQRLNKIVDMVDDSWNKDLKIRYLYRSLSILFQRDVEYFLSSYKKQLELYISGFEMKGKNVVCQSMCAYYKRAFWKKRIESKIIIVGEKEIPHYVMLVNGDKGWYYLDPLLDLMANRMGLVSSYFARIPHSKSDVIHRKYPNLKQLSKEYIFNLDKELNLLYGGEYLNFYLGMVYREMMDKKITPSSFDPNLSEMENKILFASNHLISLGKDLGICERKQFYERLIYTIFSEKERRHVKVIFEQNQETLSFVFDKDIDEALENDLCFKEEWNDGQYCLIRK